MKTTQFTVFERVWYTVYQHVQGYALDDKKNRVFAHSLTTGILHFIQICSTDLL